MKKRTQFNLLTHSMMTPAERAMGRFMRAPDGHGGVSGDKLTQADIDKAVKAAIADAKDEWDAETEGLKNKNRELLGKLRDASGVKPEDLAAAEAERDKAIKERDEAQKQVKTLSKERDDAVKNLEAETGFTKQLLIQDGIKTALIANGVKDEDFIDSLSAKFSSGAEVKVDGDQRVGVIDGKPIGDFVKEWAGTDTGKKFVSAPANSGGGAPGGKGGGGSGKVVSQEQVDAMRPKERAAFFSEGGSINEE